MAFGMVKMQEENATAFRRSSRLGSTSPRPFPNSPASDMKALVPIQCLSPVQMKERRVRGLCYNCDERWGPGHKCKSARLFIMECEDSEGEELQPIQQPQLLEETDSLSGGNEVNSKTAPEISIHALAGSSSLKIMRILGYVNGCAMVILIDTGSTHNFMDPSIQQQAHLHLQSTTGHVLHGITPTEVSLMNGEQFGKAMNQDKRGLDSYSEDPKLQKLISDFAGHNLDETKYDMKDELLFYKSVLYIIDSSVLKN
ncbi:hypothetical protein POTOM_053170 [Populus tomentosa]|uniref:Uncharacterized protein n=1 Tax=Populus tomentosa TaxID=118781 RepID=A0A8X7YBE1_POPTO|nr:hypothetical protein POTOM_053170 [Populus tomentosa]